MGLKQFRILRGSPAGTIAILGLLLVAGCTKESKIARLTAKADSLYAAGEYDKARIEYLNLIQLDPRSARAMGQLGNIFFENGIVLQAGSAMEQAVKLGADEPRLWARLGVLHAVGGRVELARTNAYRALAGDPAQEDALILLADVAGSPTAISDLKELLVRLRAQRNGVAIYDVVEAVITLKQRDAAGALALAQKAVAADPGSGAAQFVLAGVYLSQSNLVAGEPALARAAELSPPRSTRQLRYIDFLFQKEATNEARAHLEKINRQAPDFVPGRLRRAQVAFSDKDYDRVSSEVSAILNRDNINVEARLLQAQTHLAKRDAAKAQGIMDDLVKQFPNSPQIQYQAAVVYLANQNANQAQLRLDRAYELNPNSADIVMLRGRLYLARGQAGEVISSTTRLLATNASVRPAYQLLGAALSINGETNRALATYRDYERRFPEDPAGPQLTGATLLQQGKAVEARTAFERAVSLNAAYLPAIEQLVGLDLQENQASRAVERVRKFMTQQPNVPEAGQLLAQALVAAKQPQLAEQELEKLIAARPLLEKPYLMLAQLYVETQRREEALTRLNELLQKKPGETKALMLVGILQSEMGDPRKAAETYEALLKVNGSFSPALNNLAYLYSEKLNNLNRAYELARKVRQLLPDDPRVADTLGWIMYRRREFAPALIHLDEAVAKLPRNGEVQYHLGMAHYAMTHEQPARAAFQLALTLDPKAVWNADITDKLAVLDSASQTANPGTLNRLEQLARKNADDVLLLARLGQAQEAVQKLDQALGTFKRAAVLNPEAPTPLIGQARVLAAQGKHAEALTLTRKARDLAGNDANSAYELGRVAYVARDYTWSNALLQDAVSGLGGNPQVQFAFAQTALAVGRLDAARAALEKSSGGANASRASAQLKLLPFCVPGPLPKLPADIKQQLDATAAGDLLADFLKARILAADGKAAAARPALEALLKSYPTFTPATRALALVMAASPGGLEQAEKLARQVRESNPGDAEMAKVLGQAALARNDARYAIDVLLEASRGLPSDGDVFLLLGQARAQAKQVADARQALNKALTLPLNDAQKQRAQQALEQLK